MSLGANDRKIYPGGRWPSGKPLPEAAMRQEQLQTTIEEPTKKKKRCTIGAHLVWELLGRFDRPLSLMEITATTNQHYKLELTEDAVRCQLARMLKQGCVTQTPPEYDAQYGKPVIHWSATKIPPPENTRIRTDKAESAALDAALTLERRTRQLIQELSQALSWGVKSQRQKSPPYFPGTDDWLNNSDKLIQDAALFLAPESAQTNKSRRR